MTSTVPASMGGPLSEAERIAEIRVRLDAAPMPPWVTEPDEHGIRVGTQFHWVGQCPDCGATAEFEPDEAELIANAPSDLAYLLEQNARLEGQLATAKAEVVIRDGAIVGRDKAIDSLEAWHRNWKPFVDAHMKRCNGCDACDSEGGDDA